MLIESLKENKTVIGDRNISCEQRISTCDTVFTTNIFLLLTSLTNTIYLELTTEGQNSNYETT
jgi:hypothetical protein